MQNIVLINNSRTALGLVLLAWLLMSFFFFKFLRQFALGCLFMFNNIVEFFKIEHRACAILDWVQSSLNCQKGTQQKCTPPRNYFPKTTLSLQTGIILIQQMLALLRESNWISCTPLIIIITYSTSLKKGYLTYHIIEKIHKYILYKIKVYIIFNNRASWQFGIAWIAPNQGYIYCH